MNIENVLGFNTDALISMLHTNQLHYKRLYAGDFIYELAPKSIGFNHKVGVPDQLRELLGEHVSINLTTLSDKNSLWHNLLYSIMPDKYESYNWYYRKTMVDQLITALDERIGRTLAKSQVITETASTLKPDFDFHATEPSYELLFYVCLVLNVNLVVYHTGMVIRVEYHFPSACYDQSLPLIIMHADDKPIFSLISINDQLVHSSDTFTSKQLSVNAPKKHKVLAHYAGTKCQSQMYTKINGLTEKDGFKREISMKLTKYKLAELKTLATRTGISIEGRVTKQAIIDKILELPTFGTVF